VMLRSTKSARTIRMTHGLRTQDAAQPAARRLWRSGEQALGPGGLRGQSGHCPSIAAWRASPSGGRWWCPQVPRLSTACVRSASQRPRGWLACACEYAPNVRPRVWRKLADFRTARGNLEKRPQRANGRAPLQSRRVPKPSPGPFIYEAECLYLTCRLT
jgi:hypothetical protein